MRKATVAAIVAAIILGGHFLVFLFGLMQGVLGSLEGPELWETLLITSPVLSVTAASALTHLLRSQHEVDREEVVTRSFAIISIVVPVVLLLCITIVFTALYRQAAGFDPTDARIALGSIETFLGAFLGAVSDRLFGLQHAAREDSAGKRNGRRSRRR